MDEIIKIPHSNNIIFKKNPLWNLSNTEGLFSYNGEIENFSFKCKGLNQRKNFHKLSLTLAPFDIEISKIMITIEKPVYWENRYRTQFICASTNNEVLWYKSVGSFSRGGNNNLYIFNKKINLSDWFNMTHEQKNNLITN